MEASPFIVWVDAKQKIASFSEEQGYARMAFAQHDYFIAYLIELGDKWFKFK